MKELGQPIFSHYLEVFFIERYKYIKEYVKFMRGFSLFGEFIIGGSTTPLSPSVAPL